jgi:hypothetical protein
MARIEELLEVAEGRYTDSLLEQNKYLKEELDYYRTETQRLQGIIFSREETKSSDSIPNFSPLGGRYSTPSSRRRELERLERKQLREKANEPS